MIKGRAKITLTDVNTGKKEVHEQTNLVTNAVKYLYEAYIGNNKLPNDFILPLGEKALGGLMLFDDELTESAENIYFPSEAKIVGFGNRTTASSSSMLGSLTGETGAITGGYKNVWEFATNQCNGTIASLALTNYKILELTTEYSLRSGSSYGLNFKYSNGYYYSVKGTSNTSWNIYKNRGTDEGFKVNDTAGTETGELIETITVPSITSDTTSCSFDDDYIYCAYHNGTTLKYFTIKYSDDSYDVSSLITFTLSGINLFNVYPPYYNGYFYCVSSDRKTIYKINKSDSTDVTNISLGDYIMPATGGVKVISEKNNGIFCFLCSYGGQGNLIYLYPDNTLKILKKTNDIYLPRKSIRRLVSCSEEKHYYNSGNTWSSNYYTRAIIRDYLGTICNLDTPIVKDDTKTMKIEYSIIDT